MVFRRGIDPYHVSKEKATERKEICRSCDSYLSMTDQCKECWCFISLKTKLKKHLGGECPKGKW